MSRIVALLARLWLGRDAADRPAKPVQVSPERLAQINRACEQAQRTLAATAPEADILAQLIGNRYSHSRCDEDQPTRRLTPAEDKVFIARMTDTFVKEANR